VLFLYSGLQCHPEGPYHCCLGLILPVDLLIIVVILMVCDCKMLFSEYILPKVSDFSMKMDSELRPPVPCWRGSIIATAWGLKLFVDQFFLVNL
jgi:hypothetical protein